MVQTVSSTLEGAEPVASEKLDAFAGVLDMEWADTAPAGAEGGRSLGKVLALALPLSAALWCLILEVVHLL